MEENGKARIAVVSLGCPKNQVDAEVMLGLLQQGGHELTAHLDEADVIVVNTCGFIADAKRESIEALRDAVRRKRQGKARAVIATGCWVQRDAEALREAIPEVDGLVGVGAQTAILQAVTETLAGRFFRAVGVPRALLPEGLPRILSTPPWTAYIKIADGCDRRCAFCTIPRIRGPMASRPIEQIVAEAKWLSQKGVREIVLVSQDTTAYGRDLYGESRLVDLLRALCAVEGIEWIRPLYYFPTGVTEALIELTASEPKICRYMDIPLQHASRSILHAMHRPGDGEQYLALIERIRAVCPDMALRSTFIVGYPGETEADFRLLLDFVKAARLDRVGVFLFSPEEGTLAANLPRQVRDSVARNRYARLMRAQQRISLERHQEMVGRRLRVLVERVGEKGVVGRSYRDAPEIDGVVFVAGTSAKPGQFVEATVIEARPYDLVAR